MWIYVRIQREICPKLCKTKQKRMANEKKIVQIKKRINVEFHLIARIKCGKLVVWKALISLDGHKKSNMHNFSEIIFLVWSHTHAHTHTAIPINCTKKKLIHPKKKRQRLYFSKKKTTQTDEYNIIVASDVNAKSITHSCENCNWINVEMCNVSAVDSETPPKTD